MTSGVIIVIKLDNASVGYLMPDLPNRNKEE